MSDRPPKRSLDTLIREAERANLVAARNKTEALAGRGLRQEFWQEVIRTPLGLLSRRGWVLSLGGWLFSCLLLIGIGLMLVMQPPPIEQLPDSSANTAMVHVRANFSAPQKDSQFSNFFPPQGELWRFSQAYVFGWTDAAGRAQRAIIAEYPTLNALHEDYLAHTVSKNNINQANSVFLRTIGYIEERAEPDYGADWRAIRMGRLLMLVSGTASLQDQNELFSHFISITAAGHRDAIPTATPRP